MTRWLLKTAGLPEYLWALAYRAAFHKRKRYLHFAHGTTSFKNFLNQMCLILEFLGVKHSCT